MSSTSTQSAGREDSKAEHTIIQNQEDKQESVDVNQLRKQLLASVNDFNSLDQKMNKIKNRIKIINLAELLEEGFICQDQGRKIIKLDVTGIFEGKQENFCIDKGFEIIRADSDNRISTQVAALEKGYQQTLENYQKLLQLLKEKQENAAKKSSTIQELNSEVCKLRQTSHNSKSEQVISQLREQKELLEMELENEKKQRADEKATFIEIIRKLKEQKGLDEDTRPLKKKQKQFEYAHDEDRFTFSGNKQMEGSSKNENTDGIKSQPRSPIFYTGSMIKQQSEAQRKNICSQVKKKSSKDESRKDISQIGLFPKNYTHHSRFSRYSGHSNQEVQELLNEMDKNSSHKKPSKSQSRHKIIRIGY